MTICTSYLDVFDTFATIILIFAISYIRGERYGSILSKLRRIRAWLGNKA